MITGTWVLMINGRPFTDWTGFMEWFWADVKLSEPRGDEVEKLVHIEVEHRGRKASVTYRVDEWTWFCMWHEARSAYAVGCHRAIVLLFHEHPEIFREYLGTVSGGGLDGVGGCKTDVAVELKARVGAAVDAALSGKGKS